MSGGVDMPSSQEDNSELPMHQPSGSLSFDEPPKGLAGKVPRFVDLVLTEDDEDDVEDEEDESDVDLEVYFDRKGVDAAKRVGI